MKSYKFIVLICCIFFCNAQNLSSQDLARKIDFGVMGFPMPNGKGIEVVEVKPGHPADQMGIRVGDIITKFGAIEVPHMGALLFWINKKKVGDKITIIANRSGKTEILSGLLTPKPYEEGKDIIYDAFEYRGGTIRTIINRPDGDEQVPAVFFIQDYTCGSIDYSGRDYELIPRMAAQFAESGIAFIRIEKPGVGDSRTEGKCHEIGSREEGKMYEEAMKYARKLDFIDRDRMVILAHGYGGNQVLHAVKGGMPCSVLFWGYYNYFTSEKCRPLRSEKYWKESQSDGQSKAWNRLRSRVLFYHGEYDAEDNDGKEAIEINDFLIKNNIDSDYQIYPGSNHYFMKVSKALIPDMFDGDIPNQTFFRDHYDPKVVDDMISWMEKCWETGQ